MNHRERFVRTLTGQPVDRVPFIKVFGGTNAIRSHWEEDRAGLSQDIDQANDVVAKLQLPCAIHGLPLACRPLRPQVGAIVRTANERPCANRSSLGLEESP